MPTTIHIWTDNQAALKRIQEPKWCSGQAYLREVLDLIDTQRERGHELIFHWIPVHIGVPGNELADQAAQNAGDLQALSQPILRSAIKTQIQENVTKHWETEWEHAPHSRVTYLLEPKPHKKVLLKHEGLRKPESSVLIQARTGKIGLKAYLYKIEKWKRLL